MKVKRITNQLTNIIDKRPPTKAEILINILSVDPTFCGEPVKKLKLENIRKAAVMYKSIFNYLNF